MIGLLIDSVSGDLLVDGGTLAIGQTDSQTAAHVLLAQRGEYKEHPLLGGELAQHLGGPVPDPIWKSRVRRMLRETGVATERIVIDGNEISIV